MKKPKLKRDWEGRYVRLRRKQETNGGVIFEVDEVMRVTRHWRGLTLEAITVCEHCTRRRRETIKYVHESYVDLLPIGYIIHLPETT